MKLVQHGRHFFLFSHILLFEFSLNSVLIALQTNLSTGEYM